MEAGPPKAMKATWKKQTMKEGYDVSTDDVIFNYLFESIKNMYLVVTWLSSREWNAWYPIQRLQQETKWVVINNNNSTEIF